MNKLQTTVFWILASLIILSCSSGKKSFEQGNYYESVLQSVNRLRKNPDQKKARRTLADSYPLAVDGFESDIRNKLASNDPYKWTGVVSSYSKLNQMYDEIRRSPGALAVIPNPTSYFNELGETKQNAAGEQYNAGMEALKINTRESAKTAYYNFQKANDFSPGYLDVYDKIDESKYQATLKVVVDQIPAISRYSVSAAFFRDNVESFLRTDIRNEFVRFYSFEEAEQENLNPPDQILRLYFDDFVVGETHTLRNEKEVTSKDSVKVGEVELEDGTKIDVYNTVTAKLITYQKKVISKGRLAMEIFDGYSNGILSSQKITGEFIWYSEWGSFNGDERALTNEQLRITKSEETPPPPPADMFIEFTRPIYDQLTNRLGNYYRQF